uniref:Interleukin-15 receptor subunit alpha n=1 Tax=Equus caballus TaxID=9796 RepID=A0A3Q2I1C8_HORSE
PYRSGESVREEGGVCPPGIAEGALHPRVRDTWRQRWGTAERPCLRPYPARLAWPPRGGSQGARHLIPRLPSFRGITCPTPTSVEHADIRVKSYNLSSKERYICNSGFKRKAGTSSLTECVLNETTNLAHWTTPNLKCISVHQYSSRVVTAAVSIPVALLFGCAVFLLVRCRISRPTPQTASVEMENMEDAPMTRGTSGREEDT